MKNILVNGVNYKVLKDEKDAIDITTLTEKITDYYDSFDYIVGDWAYGKLRLKGFYDDKNKKSKKINQISKKEEYIKQNCAYQCKYFILKKI